MTWKPKYLIIDFDGTLFDTQKDIASSVNHVRETNGLEPFEVDKISSFVGNGAEKLISRSFADRTSDPDELEKFYRQFHAYYMKHPVADTVYYPGVREGLEAFERRIILSNKPEAMLLAILDAFGDRDFFAAAYGGDSFDVKKPDASLMDKMIEATGFKDLRDSVMIGDGQPDHDFAKAAGIPFICCNYGFSNVADDYDNMVRIDSFGEISKYLSS